MEFNLELLKTTTILYVEDDSDIRNQTLKTLEKLFKKIYVAYDGEEGYNIFNLHKDKIDIIISDINMPNKSGLEMSTEILETNHIPIILTTAHTDEAYLMKAIDLDIDKYVTKPFKIKELTLDISSLVEKYRKEKHLKKATANLIIKSKEINEEKKELSLRTDSLTREVELLRTLSDNFINIIRTDKRGVILDVSSKFCQTFGYKKNEIINKSINTVQDGNKIQKYMLDVVYQKKVLTVFHTFHTINNTKIECDMTINPSYGQDGYVESYQFYIDII